MRNHSIDLETPVAEVMTWPALSGKPNQTLLEVKEVFDRHGINHLPIVDEASVPVGMVSQSDLSRLSSWKAYFQPAQQAHSRERLLGSLLASDVMRSPVVTLPASGPVRAAARLIDSRRLHCVVVVSTTGQLVGIVTAHDLLRLAYPMQPSLIAKMGQV